MVKLGLYIKADLENVTDLTPPTGDFDWFFKIECSSCRETDENWISINMNDEIKKDGSRSTPNLVMKCKFCKRSYSASFDSESIKGYDIEKNCQFQKIAQFDCRGLDLVDFQPRGSWTCKGSESGTVFEDIDLTEEWCEYDEKASEPVGIKDIAVEFKKEK